jgi:hypothetical protein
MVTWTSAYSLVTSASAFAKGEFSLEGVSTMIFMAKVRGLSTIYKVMYVSTHVFFMPGII